MRFEKAFRRAGNSGFTLIELMIVITLLAVALTLAIPAFTGLMQKQRLKGAGERLMSELQFARSEAVATNEDILARVQGGTDWCIGLSDAGACDCTHGAADASPCEIDNTLRAADGSAYDGVTIPAGNVSISFEAVRGMPDQVTLPANPLFLDGENGKRIGVAINPIGRVSICSPAGSQKVGEYPEC